MASILHSRKRDARLQTHSNASASSQINESSKEFKWRNISRLIRRTFLALTLLVLCFLISRHSKFVFHVLSHPLSHGSYIIRGEPRFVVVVNSGSEVNPKNRHNRLASIHATWGPSAAIFVVNNVTEYPEAAHAVFSSDSQPSDPYSYPQLLLLPPGALPDRSVASLKYVIQTILERINPDFVLFTNDHTYVIPDHVCHFLGGKSPSDDLFAGHALRVNNESFAPESAGYILSRRSMQNLVTKWNENDKICNNPKERHPGLFISRCLSKRFGVQIADTRIDGKFHQFHSFPLVRLVKGDVDQWYNDKSEYPNLVGRDCCSDNQITFHYVEHLETRALYATRQALLQNPSMSDEQLKQTMISQWPSKPGDVGGYSRVLPAANEHDMWAELLHVMRKVSTLHSESSIRCLQQ